MPFNKACVPYTMAVYNSFFWPWTNDAVLPTATGVFPHLPNFEAAETKFSKRRFNLLSFSFQQHLGLGYLFRIHLYSYRFISFAGKEGRIHSYVVNVITSVVRPVHINPALSCRTVAPGYSPWMGLFFVTHGVFIRGREGREGCVFDVVVAQDVLAWW